MNRTSLMIMSSIISLAVFAQPGICLSPVLSNSMSSGLGIKGPEEQKKIKAKRSRKHSERAKKGTPDADNVKLVQD